MAKKAENTDAKTVLIEAEQMISGGVQAEQRVWRIHRDGSYTFGRNHSETAKGRFSREATDRLRTDADAFVSDETGNQAYDLWECGIVDENGVTTFAFTLTSSRLLLHRITEFLNHAAVDTGTKNLLRLPDLKNFGDMILKGDKGSIYKEDRGVLPWMEIQETEQQQNGDSHFRSYTISRDGSVFDLSMFGQIYLPELEKGGRITPEEFAELEDLLDLIQSAKNNGFRSEWRIRFFDEEGHPALQTEAVNPEFSGYEYELRNRIRVLLSGLVFPSSTFD